jgi:hypothetical protein
MDLAGCRAEAPHGPPLPIRLAHSPHVPPGEVLVSSPPFDLLGNDSVSLGVNQCSLTRITANHSEPQRTHRGVLEVTPPRQVVFFGFCVLGVSD